MSFAEIVATWPPANYVDPPTRGDGLVTASAVFGTMATIALGMRIYTRFAITRTFGIDDILIVLAYVWCIAMMICLSIASRSYGFNLHVWDIPFDRLYTANVYSLLFQVTFSLSSTFTKLSLLWFCRRLKGESRKIVFNFHDIAIVVIMAVIGVFEIIYIFMVLLQCRPIKAIFDIEPTYPYVCKINSLLLTFVASIANTITDFLTTLIPITLIARVQLPIRQRIAIMTIFAFGVTVNIAGSLRTYFEYRSMILKNLDHTWVGWPTCVCAVVEIGLGLIVTSAPALRPFMTRFMPSLLESTRRRNRYGGNGSSSAKYLYNSNSRHKTRLSNSMRGFAVLDKPQNKNTTTVVTSKVTTNQIELRPQQSFGRDQGASGINVARTMIQEFDRVTPSSPWPEPYEIRSQSGGYEGPVGSYDRFHSDFQNEQQSITRLYDEESNEGRGQRDP